MTPSAPSTPAPAAEPRYGVLGWIAAFARALVALPSFRRHMALVEASVNQQMRALEGRLDALEQQAGTVRAGAPSTQPRGTEDPLSVAVSLRELGRRVSALEGEQTPSGG